MDQSIVSTVFIRNLNARDLPAVADLHTQAFPESLLTRMGKQLICKYYEWQSQPPNECNAIGAFDGDELVGFCYSGSFRDAEVYFVIRHWYLAIPAVVKEPGLLRQIDPFKRLLYLIKAIPRKILKKFAKRNDSNNPTKKYGILSIAVSPGCQRSGVGALLVQAVHKDASAKGYTQIRLSVHPDNGKAVRFYLKKGWVKVLDKKGKWAGAMIKDLRPSG
jgi:ribosomal protein S18 acetylase RimI-like enzyme